MDLNDIWQEHKTWILGVIAGVVVFFVANSVIASTFSTDTATARIARAKFAVSKGDFYQAPARRGAREIAAETEARLKRLEQVSYFEPRGDFLLEGKGDFSTHYLSVTSRVAGQMRRAMNTANVDLLATGLGLPASSPTEREEVQHYLLGLDLVQDALERLLAASDDVLQEMPGQHGLRSIESMQVRAAPRRTTSSRSLRDAAAELGQQVTAEVKFRADSITLERWLERLRTQLGGNGERVGPRPILLESMQAEDVGRESGEPLEVKVVLLALIHKGN